MRLFLLYIGYLAGFLILSWFGWWSLMSAEITITYKLGDLLNLWKEFNMTFAMAGGVGAVFAMAMGVFRDKDKPKKGGE